MMLHHSYVLAEREIYMDQNMLLLKPFVPARLLELKTTEETPHHET